MPNHITLNPILCDGCGICKATCPQLVFTQAEPKAVAQIARPESCYGCMACEEDCPQHAIRVFRLPEGMTHAEIPQPGTGLDRHHVYDLIVIGAGPAGLGAALRARKLGLDVAVLERLPSPRRVHHPDGGLLFSVKGVYQLRRAGDDLHLDDLDLTIPGSAIQERLQDFCFVGPSGQSTPKLKKPWAGFPVVNKRAMLNGFAETAIRRGAVIAYNTRVDRISPPDSAGVRTVYFDREQQVSARVVICAEGITGNLLEKAGLKINSHKIAWSIAPYADLPPLPNPDLAANFYITNGHGHTAEDLLPYLAYFSSGPHATHIAYGPIQQPRGRVPQISATDILLEFMRKNEFARQFLKTTVIPETITWDGCRIFIRRIPASFSAQSLLAVGDTITTCGMITNMLAMKTGDLAAQTAFEALQKNDTSAAALSAYDKRVRSIQMFSGMSWMNNLLIKAPLELDRKRQDELFDLLSKFPMSRLQAGEIMPLIVFYLSILPTLLTNSTMRSYLVPGK